MPNQKGKSSRAQRGARRSHIHATTMAFSKCDNCGEQKLNHRICPACGYYSKKEIIKTKEL